MDAVLTPASLTLASIDQIPIAFYLAPLGGLAALAMAFLFNKSVLKRSEGDDEMKRIAQAVREGAMAYLTRQYRVVAAASSSSSSSSDSSTPSSSSPGNP